jgi:Tol biopolymer transport system component
VYKFGVDSGEEVLLFIPLLAGNLRSLIWSADGKSLYYHFSDAAPEKGVSLRAYDLATKREVTLHASQHIHALSLSPDGTQFAIASASPEQTREVAMANRLLLLPVTGGEPRLLRSLPPDQEFAALAWAPDGRSLLFIAERADQEDKPLVKYKVWRVSISGGEPELTRLEMEPNELGRLRFHPDGKRAALTVVGEMENEIWVLQNFLPQTRAAK